MPRWTSARHTPIYLHSGPDGRVFQVADYVDKLTLQAHGERLTVAGHRLGSAFSSQGRVQLFPHAKG
jgi:hypothetical protein